MRQRLTVLTILFLLFIFASNAQITYINTFTGNQGGFALFGQHVPNGTSNMYIDFECFGSATAGSGQGSISRVIVRGMNADADPESVIASNIICISNGIYNGENGNNDRYFVNLNVCNLPDGRYSVEIQCDEPGGDYDNSTGGSTAATTWNFWNPESPTAYYLGVSGSCGLGDGLEDINEVGEAGVSGTPQIEYFTVGDADVYRTMVVINDLFLDMGKFLQGNPTIPASLNDLATLYDPACVAVVDFPTDGFCSADALVISGAEVNTTKYTSCGNADVTGNRLFYRIHLSTDPAPAFSSFNIAYNDDCPNGYVNTFPIGGSCQNLNGIVDQRWQTTTANIDLIALSPTAGTYNLDFYTETDIVNCGGTASTVREPAGSGVYSTSFIRLDDSSPVCTGMPVELTDFRVEIQEESVLLSWETASEQVSSHFIVERSIDGRNFNEIAEVEAAGESIVSVSYEYLDDRPQSGSNYYRLKMVDLDETFDYSDVRQVRFDHAQSVSIYPTNVHSSTTLEFNRVLSSDINVAVYDLMGRQVLASTIPANQNMSQLNMASLNSGTYIVRVLGQEINYSTKIIKR